MSDDYKGDTSSTGRVTVGGAAVGGNFEVIDDADWFAVALVAGDQYDISIRWVEPGSKSSPSLSLFDTKGGRLFYDWYETADGARLLVDVPGSGTYWVEAAPPPYAGATTGAYTIDVVRTGSIFDPVTETGTSGNDWLEGFGAGNDTLDGAAGNDTLNAGVGNDSLIGGLGIDFVLAIGDVDFTLGDTTLTGSSFGADDIVGIERAYIAGSAAGDVIDAFGFTHGHVELVGVEGDDVLIGPALAGSFHSTFAHFNRLTGGDGNDTLTGGAGFDAVVEKGNVDFTLGDAALMGRGSDALNGIEAAYLFGSHGNNRIDASAFTGSFTVLSGAAGNDTLIGGGAVDWVSATATAGIGGGRLTLDGMVLSGQGTDTLSHIDKASLRGTYFADDRLDASDFGGSYVRFEGRGGDDTLIGRVDGIDRAYGSGSGNLTLSPTLLVTGSGETALVNIDEAHLEGSGGADRLDASAFDGRLVLLEGGLGNDTLIGRDDGIDRVLAHGNVDFSLTNTRLIGLGTDTLVEIDEAALVGDGDANVIDASAFTRGTVCLYGESGDDELTGGTGNDRLDGGVGDDTLDGGSGVDRVEGRGDIDFTLTDSELIGLGTDALVSIEQALLVGSTGDNTLDASAFTGSLVILEGRGGDDTLIGRADGVDRVLARGDVDFVLTDGELDGLGTDTLTDIDEVHFIGNSGANVFNASAYTDGLVVMRAGAGNDTLLGGAGDDILQGGNGADRLVGGAGADTMNGGAGGDTFAFIAVGDSPLDEAQRDLIRDFKVTSGDRLDLSAIDADTTLAGRQTFLPLTEGATFTGGFGAARALFFDTTTDTLYGNVDADSEADFAITLAGLASLLDAVFA